MAYSKSGATNAVFSLMSLTISISADDVKLYPLSVNSLAMNWVKSLPAS